MAEEETLLVLKECDDDEVRQPYGRLQPTKSSRLYCGRSVCAQHGSVTSHSALRSHCTASYSPCHGLLRRPGCCMQAAADRVCAFEACATQSVLSATSAPAACCDRPNAKVAILRVVLLIVGEAMVNRLLSTFPLL